jgi:Tat protein secretion system quality control protein TatD with DNase activity
MMIETAKKLAEVRGTSVEHIAQVTASNFEKLCLVRGYTKVSDGN